MRKSRLSERRKIPEYGIWGFIIIIFVNFFLMWSSLKNFHFNLVTRYYFPFIWLGYVLIVDALVYKFRGSSLIKNHFSDFINLFFISIIIWLIFEFTSNFIQNWQFIKLYEFSYMEYLLISTIVFSFVLPALFETTDFITTLTSFDFWTGRKTPRNDLPYILIFIGIATLILPILIPSLLFPFIWISFFLIFDSINFLNDQPSILKSISESDWKIPVSLIVAGIIVGFFWEFWNFWAYPRWVRSAPLLDFFRTFDISLIGYIFYIFFSWELFSMYHFIRFVFKKYL